MKEQQDSTTDKQRAGARRRRLLVASAYLMFRRGKRYLPPVLRAVLGVLLVGLGFLGFLPVLGFWMIPLGLALIATDFPPLGRWLWRRLQSARPYCPAHW